MAVPTHSTFSAWAGGLLFLSVFTHASASPQKLVSSPSKLPTAVSVPRRGGATKLPPVKRPATSAASTPDQVVQAFLKAQQAGDDEKAYTYLSTEAKKRLRESLHLSLHRSEEAVHPR